MSSSHSLVYFSPSSSKFVNSKFKIFPKPSNFRSISSQFQTPDPKMMKKKPKKILTLTTSISSNSPFVLYFQAQSLILSRCWRNEAWLDKKFRWTGAQCYT